MEVEEGRQVSRRGGGRHRPARGPHPGGELPGGDVARRLRQSAAFVQRLQRPLDGGRQRPRRVGGPGQVGGAGVAHDGAEPARPAPEHLRGPARHRIGSPFTCQERRRQRPSDAGARLARPAHREASGGAPRLLLSCVRATAMEAQRSACDAMCGDTGSPGGAPERPADAGRLGTCRRTPPTYPVTAAGCACAYPSLRWWFGSGSRSSSPCFCAARVPAVDPGRRPRARSRRPSWPQTAPPRCSRSPRRPGRSPPVRAGRTPT